MATEKKKPKDRGGFQTVKGMHDILPEEAPYWDRVRHVFREIASFYRFEPIETPVLEHADLFIRGVGLGTDIVEKEMYTLRTKGGDHLALRPELTAPIIRSYIEHGMSRLPQPVRLAYMGPAFRHENPQAGRYRQFYQVGFEIVGGESDPIYDAQIIVATARFYEALRVRQLSLHVNSIGCKVCRPLYRRRLLDFYRRELAATKGRRDRAICKECERRMDGNALRLLDCKDPLCEPVKLRAPSVLDHLCGACRAHFKEVLEFLDEVKVAYTLNPFLVRGLDYYSRTVFEFFTNFSLETRAPEAGAELAPETSKQAARAAPPAALSRLALGGGGRYDYLAELLGGKSIPAVGSAPGVERTIEAMKAWNALPDRPASERVFVARVGSLAKRLAFSLVEELRRGGVKVFEALGKESLQAQLKQANSDKVPLALILGQKEVYEKSVIVRDMESGAQEVIPIERVVEEVKKRLHK